MRLAITLPALAAVAAAFPTEQPGFSNLRRGAALSKRQDYTGDIDEIKCQRTNSASYIAFTDGAAYLSDMNAALSAEAGECSRISCSHSAGIALCNPGSSKISVSSVRIAQYTGMIGSEDDCDVYGVEMGGEAFDVDGWSVLAVEMDCGGDDTWSVKDSPP